MALVLLRLVGAGAHGSDRDRSGLCPALRGAKELYRAANSEALAVQLRDATG
jgi:hypothetical protein